MPDHIRDHLPDLVVQWNDKVVTPLMGVSSNTNMGGVPISWVGETGRTGCHTGDAWALVRTRDIPNLRMPSIRPHVVDIVATVCSGTRRGPGGLAQVEPLLVSAILAMSRGMSEKSTIVIRGTILNP